MPKFEAHITCNKLHGPTVKQTGEQHGWSFSEIDGDPLMGAKPYCYLTAYDPDGQALLARMLEVAQCLEEDHGVPVLRTKVERIVYDSKTGWDELSFTTPVVEENPNSWDGHVDRMGGAFDQWEIDHFRNGGW